MAAAEMVIGSSGTTTGIEVIELIDSKSMTAAMETANKVVSAYQAPNK
jgi:flagellar hook-basal body complex protein FliE